MPERVAHTRSSLVSQSTPVKPRSQVHVYPSRTSVHQPLFRQGLLLHSLISEKFDLSSCHFQQGAYIILYRLYIGFIGSFNTLMPLPTHTHTSVAIILRPENDPPLSQRSAVYPAAQSQVKSSIRSLHVPPFWQGELAHSSSSVSFKRTKTTLEDHCNH